MDLKTLRLGASLPCDGTTVNEEIPEWLDMEKFKRGQQFYQRHMSVCFLAMHYSLVVGLSVSSLLEALVFTGQSDTANNSIKRYLDTAKHIYDWHTGNVWNDPEDAGYKSIRKVRNLHFQIARRLKGKLGLDKEDKRDDKSVTLHFSQYDMALVQTGFMGAITMYPEKSGISPSKKELEDYIHFWRGIGYILGVMDDYNICKGNYEETFNICKEIEEHVLIPSLKDPPTHYELMADAYCDGINSIFRFSLYSREAITAFVLTNMGQPVLRSLSWKDWVRFNLYKTQISCFRWIPGLERFLSWRSFKDFDKISALLIKEVSQKSEVRTEEGETKPVLFFVSAAMSGLLLAFAVHYVYSPVVP